MSLSITADDLPKILVLLVLASVLGYLSDLFAGGRVPLGFFGSILWGLLGAWVANDVVRPHLPVNLPKEPVFDGVALVSAALGAFIFSLFWCVFTSRLMGRR